MATAELDCSARSARASISARTGGSHRSGLLAGNGADCGPPCSDRSHWRLGEFRHGPGPGGRVNVFHEYAARTGPIRDAVQATMDWWLRQLEDRVSAGLRLGHLAPCDPAQVAFEIQALLGAGGHQSRLRHDVKAIPRAQAAIRDRLETLRGPAFPALAT
jgi:hypothetical protein